MFVSIDRLLESVNGTRYGCTVRGLAYLSYGIGRYDAVSPGLGSPPDCVIDEFLPCESRSHLYE